MKAEWVPGPPKHPGLFVLCLDNGNLEIRDVLYVLNAQYGYRVKREDNDFSDFEDPSSTVEAHIEIARN